MMLYNGYTIDAGAMTGLSFGIPNFYTISTSGITGI